MKTLCILLLILALCAVVVYQAHPPAYWSVLWYRYFPRRSPDQPAPPSPWRPTLTFLSQDRL